MRLMSPMPIGINSSKNRDNLKLNSDTKCPPYRHDYLRKDEPENRNINGSLLRIHRINER